MLRPKYQNQAALDQWVPKAVDVSDHANTMHPGAGAQGSMPRPRRLYFKLDAKPLKCQDPAFLAIGGAVASFTMVAQLYMIQGYLNASGVKPKARLG